METCQYNMSTASSLLWKEKAVIGDAFFHAGELSSETLTLYTFEEEGGVLQELPVKNFLLGCSRRSSRAASSGGKCQAGILGLGRGPFSFLSQVGGLFERQFAYYLGPVDPQYYSYGEAQAAGNIYFGALHSSSSEALYTPLIMDPSSSLYSLKFNAISIADHLVQLPLHTAAVLDTATAPMLLPFLIFLDVAEALSRAVSFPYFMNASVGGGSAAAAAPPTLRRSCEALCYTVGSSELDIERFPQFFFHFANARFRIPRSNSYLQLNSTTICLAMLGCSAQEFIVLGNRVQQRFMVMYDLEKKQVGFVPPTP